MQTQRKPHSLKMETRKLKKTLIREIPTSSGNRIVMHPGSVLEFVESDSGAYRRMILSWLDSPEISDHDFRQAVRSITR